ncbi:exonuclease [Escherichia coli]|nr:exonuclease [Escherichia coli]
MFDPRILKQATAAHSYPADWLDELTVYCAMKLTESISGPPTQWLVVEVFGVTVIRKRWKKWQPDIVMPLASTPASSEI